MESRMLLEDGTSQQPHFWVEETGRVLDDARAVVLLAGRGKADAGAVILVTRE
jgi:hypothetical protein